MRRIANSVRTFRRANLDFCLLVSLKGILLTKPYNGFPNIGFRPLSHLSLNIQLMWDGIAWIFHLPHKPICELLPIQKLTSVYLIASKSCVSKGSAVQICLPQLI